MRWTGKINSQRPFINWQQMTLVQWSVATNVSNRRETAMSLYLTRCLVNAHWQLQTYDIWHMQEDTMQFLSSNGMIIGHIVTDRSNSTGLHVSLSNFLTSDDAVAINSEYIQKFIFIKWLRHHRPCLVLYCVYIKVQNHVITNHLILEYEAIIILYTALGIFYLSDQNPKQEQALSS